MQSKHAFRRTIKANAMAKKRHEVQQMLAKRVWRPVLWDYLTDEERRPTITSSMLRKEKFAADGEFD